MKMETNKKTIAPAIELSEETAVFNKQTLWEKDIKQVLTHELGHALVYVLFNGFDGLYSISVWGNKQDVRGQTFSDMTTAPVLFGGVVAENICGFTKVKIHRGTDAEKIAGMYPNKTEREKTRKEVERILTPYRNALLNMATELLNNHPIADPLDFSITILHDELLTVISKNIDMTKTL